MKRTIILTWAGLVLAAVLLGACGKKTAPLPPQAVTPSVVTDLGYQLDDQGVTLAWTPPRLTVQGDNLPPIDKFLLERAAYEIAAFCEGCPVHYMEVGAIAGAQAPGSRGQAITYRDEGLRPGHIYFYRVKTRLGWRVVSRPSEPVSFRWQSPLAPPSGLVSRAGDHQVVLSWQPPTGDLAGAPLAESVRYQVYRRAADGDFLPLGSPGAALGFTDQAVDNGVDYQYKVRAGKAAGGTGVFSEVVTAVPHDLTPPPAPQGLAVIATPNGSRLFWRPVTVGDLGGYRILRRCEDGGADREFQELGRVAAPVTAFIDKTLNGRRTCYYAVRAFDAATPANESPLSDQIKMKRDR
jgi:hypothetical protein